MKAEIWVPLSKGMFTVLDLNDYFPDQKNQCQSLTLAGSQL